MTKIQKSILVFLALNIIYLEILTEFIQWTLAGWLWDLSGCLRSKVLSLKRRWEKLDEA